MDGHHYCLDPLDCQEISVNQANSIARNLVSALGDVGILVERLEEGTDLTDPSIQLGGELSHIHIQVDLDGFLNIVEKVEDGFSYHPEIVTVMGCLQKINEMRRP